jgi:N-hydroxyarylamine O-acetyltransferase
MPTMNIGDGNAVDLERYCTRVGYSGALEPALATLADLIEHHTAAIPFENIDVLLDRGIDISPEAVDAKLIGPNARRHGRGGYCYEHNGLFKRVLAAIGFHVEPLAARVVWMAQEGAVPLPRTHMALRVTLDGEPWLVDVGFGGCVPTSPLRLAETAPQMTRHGPFRVIPHGGLVVVEAQLGDAWRPLYELSLDPLLDVDFEPPNWFVSTHPTSLFRHGLMVACATRDARYMLMNGRLTIRGRDGSVERRNLDADELEIVLADTFGLLVDPTWRPLLQRVAVSGNPA